MFGHLYHRAGPASTDWPCWPHNHPHWRRHRDPSGSGPRGRFAAGFEDDSPSGPHSRRGDFGGRGPYGPPGRRGGRMFGPGDLRLVVLRLLGEQPRHGYELIKAIGDAFGGHYAPSPGAIYPTLSLLEEQDLIASVPDADDGKKRFRVTAAGAAVLAENRDVIDGVMDRMRMAAMALAGDRPPEAVLQAMQTLKHALAMRRAHWSDAEAARVSALIVAAAEAIVRAPAADKG